MGGTKRGSHYHGPVVQVRGPSCSPLVLFLCELLHRVCLAGMFVSVTRSGGEERTERAIQPRFVPSAVGEPAIRPADGDVEDEVERCYICGCVSKNRSGWGGAGRGIRVLNGAAFPAPAHGSARAISCEAFETVAGKSPRWKKGMLKRRSSVCCRRLST